LKNGLKLDKYKSN